MLFDLLRNAMPPLKSAVLSLVIPCLMVFAPQVEAKQKSQANGQKKIVVAVKGKPAAAKSRQGSRARHAVSLAEVPAKASFGQLAGLHSASDPLDLRSSVALVVDQDTQEVLFRKNDQVILPIASLTKLMTGLVMAEAKLPLHEIITISQEDVDTEKGSFSRLAVGTISHGVNYCTLP